MGQNTSSAVMQQRHVSRDEFDYYPTHPWATRALCEVLRDEYGYALSNMTALEPACGEGFMSRPLAEYFSDVTAHDIQDFRSTYPEQSAVSDFLLNWGEQKEAYDAVITNPPFTLAEQFISRAFEVGSEIVCIFARSAFLEGGDRYESLFKNNPPSAVYQFSERVALQKGRLEEKASSATAYSWFIWIQGERGTRLDWFPKGTRDRLLKKTDYPDWAKDVAPCPLFEGAA